MIKQLKESLRKKFNSAQSLPDEDEHKTFWGEGDPGENAETTPPDDEFIDLNCLWVVEFYTPDQRNNLIDGFRKLGWEYEDTDDVNSRNPVVWLNGPYRRFQGGAWLSLGTLIPEGSERRFLGPTHRVPLPPGISYAHGKIQNISPSLNCIVICFVLRRTLFSQVRQGIKTRTEDIHNSHTDRSQDSSADVPKARPYQAN